MADEEEDGEGVAGAIISVKVDGQTLDDDFEKLITELVIEDALHLPDLAELTFIDLAGDELKSLPFKVGAVLEASLQIGESTPARKFKGDIVSLATRFDGHEFSTTVRALDAGHQLAAGRMTETFKEATASDIAKKIASKLGLDMGTIEATSTQFETLSIMNQPPLDFLRSLAARSGREAVVADGKFHFRKPLTDGSPVVLTPQRSIKSIDVVVSGAQQVSKVVQRGWDPKKKEAIVAETSVETKSMKGGKSPAQLAGLLKSDAKMVSASVPIRDQSHATAIAGGQAELMASSHQEVQAVLSGNPKVTAGATVKITDLGEPFDCTATVTATRHVYDIDGYRTELTIAGRQDRTLSGLLAGEAHAARASKIEGLVPAIVTNPKDPDGYGRVKVAFRWLDDDHESGWARVGFPGGGKDRGVAFLPHVDDEVLVGFLWGDPDQPIVVGSLHNPKDKPPEHKGDDHYDGTGAAVQHGVYSVKHQLQMVDKAGEHAVHLGSRDKAYHLTLDVAGKKITINSDGSVEITGKGDISIKAGGKLAMEAKADLTLKGKNVKIEAEAAAELKAAGNVSVKGAQIALG